ncbi:MAG: DUF4340 domain-containing protein [Deltaproteobacteria bacterium]|jgi:hypothetical protein|nr:DUF4340 domain-containing protein [Deltaproteobacteria bacterium]
MRRKILLLLIATLFCAFGGWYLFSRQGIENVTGRKTEVLFPNIGDRVAKISIEQGDDVLVMQLDNSGSSAKWVLPDNDMYPADSGKVNSFVLKVINAPLSQKITKNPEQYTVLGVDENCIEHGSSKVIFYDQSGIELGSIYLGNIPLPKENSDLSAMPIGQYIRKTNDKQVYLVSDVISPKVKMGDWIVTNLATVDPSNISKITQSSVDGEIIFVLSPVFSDAGEVMEEFRLAADYENIALNEEAIYLIKSGIQNLQIEDAYKEENLNKADNPLFGQLFFDLLTTYTLTNGITYKIFSGEAFNRVYIKLEVGFNEENYKTSRLTSGKTEVELFENIQKLKEQLVKANQNYVGWFYLLPSYANSRFRQR